MFVITTAALVQLLCVDTRVVVPGFPDTGDGIGGAIAIPGYMGTGTNPNIHPRVGLMVKKESPAFSGTFAF